MEMRAGAGAAGISADFLVNVKKMSETVKPESLAGGEYGEGVRWRGSPCYFQVLAPGRHLWRKRV